MVQIQFNRTSTILHSEIYLNGNCIFSCSDFRSDVQINIYFCSQEQIIILSIEAYKDAMRVLHRPR